MRRHVSLYIAGRLADLGDEALILYNWQMDDLENPAIVKIGYTQQIKLKGTPANNRIFGDSFRADRRISGTGGASGVDYNAGRKTPFAIYSDTGEILESGFVKLDNVSRKGADIDYTISLYGGLGSFFYALAYDANGNRRTLADLDYLGTATPEHELDFAITAQAVQEAWRRLQNDSTAPAMWDVVNFAPCYNGIPAGNFAPNKGIVDPTKVGLPASVQEEGGNYESKNGLVLVNLAERQEEWAVKDLRSYLQRPVFSMRAFWRAVCNPANNGGYQVDASAILDDASFGRYANLWLTLPLLSSIGAARQDEGISLAFSTATTSSTDIGRYDVVGTVASGTKLFANLNVKIRLNTTSAATEGPLYMYASQLDGRISRRKWSVLFVQAVAYASDNSIMGASPVKILTPSFHKQTGAEIAAQVATERGYTPVVQADYEKISVDRFTVVQTGLVEIPVEIGLSVEAQDVAYYKVFVANLGAVSTGTGDNVTISYNENGTRSLPFLYRDYSTGYYPISAFMVLGESGNTVSYTTSETLRSGATVTKSMLLSSSHTPADYMLSFCKVFGLYFNFDPATQKVTILKRNDLYKPGTIDLSRRVDLSRGISIDPLVFDSKWYDFELAGAGGAFYEEYEKQEGRPYGIQRVNTGFDFNADSVNLMDTVVYRNACTILGRSKYYNTITVDGRVVPSVFLDKGNTYTLWGASGDTKNYDISCPPASATVAYWNDSPDRRGYDIDSARKLEFRGPDGQPVAGENVLVFLEGWDTYPDLKITDDIPAMDALNDGVPCWLLEPGHGARVPSFQRYAYGETSSIEDSLDFGVPRLLDIPGVRHQEGVTVYAKGWRAYMVDRYNENTKVLRCWVDFSGLQVNASLLTRFYWWENSLWVLNRISNYSLTTFDPVECEFVQVQDIDNYLNGQDY